MEEGKGLILRETETDTVLVIVLTGIFLVLIGISVEDFGMIFLGEINPPVEENAVGSAVIEDLGVIEVEEVEERRLSDGGKAEAKVGVLEGVDELYIEEILFALFLT